MSTIKTYLLAGAAILIVLLLGILGTWGAWTYRGHLADKEVTQVKEDYAQLFMKERQLTDHYKEQADVGYKNLMDAVTNIKVVHTTVNTTIQEEKKSNPDFYNQPLPDGGRKAWLDARTLMQ